MEGNGTSHPTFLLDDANRSLGSVVESFFHENLTLENMSYYPNNSTPPPLSPEAIEVDLNVKILMTLLYATISVVGILGNIGVCVVVVQNRLMHTATNYYLCSMALSDLLLLVTGMPHEFFLLWVGRPYVFGLVFCVVRGLTAEMSTNASILTITAFTVERYIGICHPLRSHVMSHLGRVIKFIVSIWCLAFIFAIPQCIQYGITPQGDCNILSPVSYAFELSTFLFFIVPMTLITVLYMKIIIELRSQHLGRCHSTRHEGAIAADRSRSVINMLVAVVVAFFICFAPFHAQRLVAFYGDYNSEIQRQIYTFLTNVSGITFYLSTCINPVLYHILSRRFRQAFKDTLGRCCISCHCNGCVDPPRENFNSCPSTKRLGVVSLNPASFYNHNRGMSTEASRVLSVNTSRSASLNNNQRCQNGLRKEREAGGVRCSVPLVHQATQSTTLTVDDVPNPEGSEKVQHHTWV